MIPPQHPTSSISSSPSSADATKNVTAVGIGKSLLLLLITCFGAFLLVRHSRRSSALLNQIGALESLKKQYDHDKTELVWDKRRIEELEEQVQTMRNGFERTASHFLPRKRELEEGNLALEEAIRQSAAGSDGVRREDRISSPGRLSEEASGTREELIAEKQENAALTKMLAEMREEIERHGGIRGNRQKERDERPA